MSSPTSAGADARLRTPRLAIDLGDDTGEFRQDGECDDPRFAGDGMGRPAGNSSHRGRDATDCRRLYEAGRLRVFGVDPDSGNVDFGDDTSTWARDGDCDDPRFDGPGMDPFPLSGDRGHDTTDCRRLYNAGRVRLSGVAIRGVR